jgi:hypothetical protein
MFLKFFYFCVNQIEILFVLLTIDTHFYKESAMKKISMIVAAMLVAGVAQASEPAKAEVKVEAKAEAVKPEVKVEATKAEVKPEVKPVAKKEVKVVAPAAATGAPVAAPTK